MAKKAAVKKAPKAAKKQAQNGVSAAEIGRHLDMSRQRVGQLEAESVFKRLDNGRYDLTACRIAYIRWLKDENRRGSKAAGASRVQDARTREIERRMAREDGQLVEADDVQALVIEIVGGFVSELHGVPAGASRDPAVRSAIEEVLNGAIDRCRARFEKLGADLRSGRGIILEDQEGDA